MSGVPAEIVESIGAAMMHDVDLKEGVVLQKAGIIPWQISGRYDRTGIFYEKPHRVHTYIGLYDGDVNNIDQDAEGEVEKFVEMPLSQILEELETNPDRFTPDVQELIVDVAEKFKTI